MTVLVPFACFCHRVPCLNQRPIGGNQRSRRAGATHHASRFTFHASRGDQFVRKNRQIPARPANGKCLSISILHHESRRSCRVLWTQFPRPCQTQLTGALHVTNAVTSLEFVRFVPATSRTPRPLRPPRQTQIPATQHKMHAGTLSDFVRKTGRMGGQTPTFFRSPPDPRQRSCVTAPVRRMFRAWVYCLLIRCRRISRAGSCRLRSNSGIGNR